MFHNKHITKWIIVYCMMAAFLFSLSGTAFAAHAGTPAKEPKSITLNEKTIEIKKGASFTLIAVVTGMKNSVTWKSSNKKVATVKGGVVTGRGKGTATITAKCGKRRVKCKVKVMVSYSAEQAVAILEKKLKSRNRWKSAACYAYSTKYDLKDCDEDDLVFDKTNDILVIFGPASSKLKPNRVSCVVEYSLGGGAIDVYAEINLETGKASIYVYDEWKKSAKLPKTMKLW